MKPFHGVWSSGYVPSLDFRSAIDCDLSSERRRQRGGIGCSPTTAFSGSSSRLAWPTLGREPSFRSPTITPSIGLNSPRSRQAGNHAIDTVIRCTKCVRPWVHRLNTEAPVRALRRSGSRFQRLDRRASKGRADQDQLPEGVLFVPQKIIEQPRRTQIVVGKHECGSIKERHPPMPGFPLLSWRRQPVPEYFERSGDG